MGDDKNAVSKTEKSPSLANLRPPWKPGQSGNPGGRPKGRGLTDRLRALLEKAEAGGRTGYDALIEAAVAAAKKGDHRFFKEIYDRIEGKVPDRQEISGPDAGPIEARLKGMTETELTAMLAGRTVEDDEDGEGDGRSAR